MDPAETCSERDHIGTHQKLIMRSDPPCRPKPASMAFRIGGRQRCLPNAAHAVQNQDSRLIDITRKGFFDRP
jgi:hypothetical protein